MPYTEPQRWLSGLLALVLAFSALGFSESVVEKRQLPKEALETIALIRKGGPFPYDRDGVVFGNREGLLPKEPRGHYREYTVPTPGAKNRGARRIVCGGKPAAPSACWCTADHYQSFARIRE